MCVCVSEREREMRRESWSSGSAGELLTSGGRRSHGNILSTEPSGAAGEQSATVGTKTPESYFGGCFYRV